VTSTDTTSPTSPTSTATSAATSPAALENLSFSEVDASAAAEEMVDVLDIIAGFAAVQRLKGAATALLSPALGQRFADIGCGTGEDARLLAATVGPQGSVIGIDPSTTMLGVARARTIRRDLPLEFRVGDATALPLADGDVDGCRCERVFQHLDDPERALAEMVRVTRRGGRVVVVDTDWGMHALHGADPGLTAKVLDVWFTFVRNGTSGRRLTSQFVRAGLLEPTIVAETFVSVDAARPTLTPFPAMAAAAHAAGALSEDEADAWLAQLVDAGRRGEFFWAATMFAVGATRP
jgi:ubiquinone/menaquinone biosynthesis C-methylase UbiE